MDFLRQPRREPQKPPSRKREADKKRSDRERQEVSAFFQNTSSRNPDTRDRKKPTAAWPSSAREPTADASSQVSGLWRPASRPAIPDENVPRPRTTPQQQQQQHEQRESSKATTYLTWTTSRGSSLSGARFASKSPRRRNSTRSPTPLDVREALAETGVFRNTGIRCMVPNGQDDRNYAQDDRSMSKHSGTSPRFQSRRPRQDEPVRIIRYQDRGTMMVQEGTPHSSPSKHTRTSHVHAFSVTTRDTTQQASATPTIAQTSPNTASTSGVPVQPPCRTGVEHVVPNAKQPADEPLPSKENAKERDVQPERPMAPKLSVVERLEAAANSHWQSPTERETMPNARYSEWHPGYPAGHLPSRPISHEGAYRWPIETAGLSMIRGRDMPIAAPASCFVSTQSMGLHVGDMPTHEMLDETPCNQAAQVPPYLMASQNSWQAAQQDRQGIQDYIAQIEREVLEKPQDNVADEPAPLIVLDNMDAMDDVEPARGHPFTTQLGVQLPSRISATPVRNSPSGAERRYLMPSWNFEDTEEEERKFMSSFWRPNRQSD